MFSSPPQHGGAFDGVLTSFRLLAKLILVSGPGHAFRYPCLGIVCLPDKPIVASRHTYLGHCVPAKRLDSSKRLVHHSVVKGLAGFRRRVNFCIISCHVSNVPPVCRAGRRLSSTPPADFRELFLTKTSKRLRFSKYQLSVRRLREGGGIEKYLTTVRSVLAEKGGLQKKQFLTPLLSILARPDIKHLAATVITEGLERAAADLAVPPRVARKRLPELRSVIEAALLVDSCSLPVQLDDGSTVAVTLGIGSAPTNLTALVAKADSPDTDCLSLPTVIKDLLDETAERCNIRARLAACAESITNDELVPVGVSDKAEAGNADGQVAGLAACSLVLRAFVNAGDVPGSQRWADRIAACVAPLPWRVFLPQSLLHDFDALVGVSSQDTVITQEEGSDGAMIEIALRLASATGKHGAVVVDANGTILANSSCVRTGGGRIIHAEMAALRNLLLHNGGRPLDGLEQARGSTLYVGVFGAGDGHGATIAGPCGHCSNVIKALGVARVCFTTDYGLEDWYPKLVDTAPLTDNELRWLGIEDSAQMCH